MLRLTNIDNKISETTNLILGEALDCSKLIPITFGGRLVNELGKQLLKACSDGDTSEIRRLLTEGAPFTADWLGTSPLHLAAQCNHLEVCEILLRAGVSTNCRTKVDRTPLHMAAYEGNIDIANLLMKEEAEIDCTDLLGMTPLHWAVQRGHAGVVQALLKCGAQKNLVNKFCLKPTDIARQINRSDIVEILEREQHEDPMIATENLTIEMAVEDDNLVADEVPRNSKDGCIGQVEVSACSFEDDDSQLITLGTSDNTQADGSISDSMKILQDHGITLLPNDDDNNILSTVMESGHSVVLTDIGKQILDTVSLAECSDDITTNLNKKNFITITADQFLALANTNNVNKNQHQAIKQIKDNRTLPKYVKRIVMKKNKMQPINPVPNLKHKILNQIIQPSNFSETTATEIDVALIKKKLEVAKKSIEQYKLILLEKEAEVEKYQQQLNLLGYS